MLRAADKNHSREVAKLRSENRALRRQLREMDAQGRQDRCALGSALVALAKARCQLGADWQG